MKSSGKRSIVSVGQEEYQFPLGARTFTKPLGGGILVRAVETRHARRGRCDPIRVSLAKHLGTNLVYT
jgi:hypothetical protein